MSLKTTLRNAAPAAAGFGLLACGVCCIPVVAAVGAALGFGAIASGIDETVSKAIGGGLIIVSALLFLFQKRKSNRCASPTTACGCSPASAAPIACTLTPGQFKDRSLWLKALAERALISHTINDATAVLLYKTESKEDVEVMVQQERECCSFLQYSVAELQNGIQVTIVAPPSELIDLRILLSNLVPSSALHKSHSLEL